jgi:hypothetical protein
MAWPSLLYSCPSPNERDITPKILDQGSRKERKHPIDSRQHTAGKTNNGREDKREKWDVIPEAYPRVDRESFIRNPGEEGYLDS